MQIFAKFNLTLALGMMFFNSLAQNEVKPEPAFSFLSCYNNVRDFVISEQQDEIYCTIQSPNQETSLIVCATKTKKKWLPEIMPFSGIFQDLEPFLSPDQLKLFFASNRPLSDTGTIATDYNIWYVERKTLEESWSSPIALSSAVNSPYDEFYPTLSKNQNLYFTSDRPDGLGKDDIYYSEWNGNSYNEPKRIKAEISTSGYEFNAFIAPNEDFLLFTKYNATDGLGSGDLYISRKSADGTWQTPVNLGISVNSKAMDYCPFYDTTTETLYFTSRRSSIESKHFKDLNELSKTVNQYENGFSRIYKVKIKL